MNEEAKQLNSEIDFSRWFIRDLMDDPLLNEKILQWMRMILKELERNKIEWELQGYDGEGNRHSFHSATISKN